jgi:hypothetical protein
MEIDPLQKDYESWLFKRIDSSEEHDDFGFCYCGHTFTCDCGDPSFGDFIDAVKRGDIVIGDDATTGGTHEPDITPTQGPSVGEFISIEDYSTYYSEVHHKIRGCDVFGVIADRSCLKSESLEVYGSSPVIINNTLYRVIGVEAFCKMRIHVGDKIGLMVIELKY